MMRSTRCRQVPQLPANSSSRVSPSLRSTKTIATHWKSWKWSKRRTSGSKSTWRTLSRYTECLSLLVLSPRLRIISIQDIESKAFKIKQQREEYLRSLEMNDNFKRQLADADKEIQQSLSVRDSLQRQLTYTRTELERYQRENGNLSTQVGVALLVTYVLYLGSH